MPFFYYIHTCPNGKRYIGTTHNNVNLRWKNGEGYKTQIKFYRAIQKYGWNNIKHEVYEANTESEMYYAERYLIAFFQTMKEEFGYNVSSGGEYSSVGCTISEAHKLAISKKNKNRKHTEEEKKSISQKNKGRNAGEKNGMYGRRGCLSPRYNQHLSEKSKNQISESLKEHYKKYGSKNKNKSKPKYQWLTPQGEIVEMSLGNAHQHHPDWVIYKR